jgi:hypothetical protein
MKRTRCLLAAIVVVFVFLWFAFPAPRPIVFANVTEASVNIKAAGFHCTSDRNDGIIQSGFLITTEEANWKVANDLCKVGKMGPDWKGKVWISYSGLTGTLCNVPDDATTRTWGGVCAFGDSNLLDQIEGTLRAMM